MNDRFIKKLWHTNRKIFLKEFSILQTIHSDGTVEHTYFEYKPKTQELERLSSCQIKEINCTGLKDKNGKLIFEGDIILIPDIWEEYGTMAGAKREIYFNEGGFRLKPKWNKNSRGNWLEDTKDFEVIGNIYENKELLE